MTKPKNPKRILVVEDDPIQREIYAALAYYNGYEVDEAGSMSATLAYLQTQCPDAILLDIMLPDANALEAIGTIRAAVAPSEIPIICMTAFDIHPSRASAAGCDTLLCKPFNGLTLVRAIERCLKRSAGPNAQAG